MQFNVRFYLVALFFIIFDVEIVFILPWAVVFNDMLETLGPLAFWDMAVFVGILALGLLYVWRKGDLQWVKGLTDRSAEEIDALSHFSSGKKLQRDELGVVKHG